MTLTRIEIPPDRNPTLRRVPDLILANTLCCQPSLAGAAMQIGQLERREFITLLGGAASGRHVHSGNEER